MTFWTIVFAITTIFMVVTVGIALHSRRWSNAVAILFVFVVGIAWFCAIAMMLNAPAVY